MIKGNQLSILVLQRVQYIFFNLARTLVTGLLLTTAISTHSASAEDRLVADNLSSKVSFAEIPQKDSLASEIVTAQDLSWGQIAIEDDQPNLEFSSLQIPQENFAPIAKVANQNADLGQAVINSQTAETTVTQPKLATQADSSGVGVVGDTLNVANQGVILEPEIITSRKAENSLKQPKLVAQADSSGVVGDTLGETNRLRQQLLIEPIATLQEPLTVAPGSSAGTPTGYGASWRQAFVGGGVYFPLDKGDLDGSLIFGFGVGDAVKSVGLEFDFNVISTGGQSIGGDFGDSGAIGLKLHKYFADGTAVAVGWFNPIKWGDAGKDKETIYGVVSKAFDLQPNNQGNKLPLTLSVGIGSGDFSSLGALRRGDNSVNVFGSVGLRVAPQVSLVSSWTGNALNMGASFAPLRKTPIVVNTIFTDVTSNFANGLGFALNVGYIFEF
ncbi:hypothetical protein BV378_31345 [Nostoc sp. RF31YmG]|nr:hypothetical protein BV378_31345 [Nostoc sp. RF31YmG]